MSPILLRAWDLLCMSSIQGSHMASSFLDHMGFAVGTVVYSVHQIQRARLAVETVHFVRWEQPGFPDKHQVVRGQAFWLAEGKFPGKSSSALRARLPAKQGLAPPLSAFLHG